MPRDYRKEVIKSVNTEFVKYKQDEIAKPVEEIFDDSVMNNFYCEMYGYFENIEDDEEKYRVLHRDSGNIIGLLWDFFLKGEYGIANYGEISELVSNYTGRQDEIEME